MPLVCVSFTLNVALESFVFCVFSVIVLSAQYV